MSILTFPVSTSKTAFQGPLSEFIFNRTYAKWRPEDNRRETWSETVFRYMDFMQENLGNQLTHKEYNEVWSAIHDMQVMPSMRLLWSAGAAARVNNVAAYNCAFIVPEAIDDFAEIMYLSMSGTGVGYSVENAALSNLPMVSRTQATYTFDFVIADSREGWCDALKFGMHMWFIGNEVNYDYSQLRPAGARLKTMGGQSSGPEPLRRCLEFTREVINSRRGQRLTTLNVHDIICKIGEVVMAGGVRRSAFLSLSELRDTLMRDCKAGQFYLTEGQRSMANNSAIYDAKPAATEFIEEWLALIKSGSGERGVFNRGDIMTQVPERRRPYLVDSLVGCNPCAEIILRTKQFCNLSEIVARPTDTLDSLLRKARVAAILGTYQSSLTNFEYISPKWKENCEQERLLGVSITGILDCALLKFPMALESIREEVVRVNTEYAQRFGISPSTATTAVKPSGTVSLLVNSSSGIHPRFAPFYIRRVRINSTDPLFKLMKAQGMPYKPEVGQDEETANTYVLEFPVAAPKDSVFAKDMTWHDQLESWLLLKKWYTEHNPSCTVYVGEDEWVPVAAWVYEHWEQIGGISFLPRTGHVYQLAPYEEITEAEYHTMLASMPKIDYTQLLHYEQEDCTVGSKELACMGGSCEL
jgi:ribonucleoside-triphosphate reductase (thioredoxin)